VSLSWVRVVSTRSMAAGVDIVDVEDDLSADTEIEESSRVTSEELCFSNNFGASEEDELNTVSVTTETAVIVDDPNDTEIFDDRNDFRGILRSE
jgi:hypothetical protein